MVSFCCYIDMYVCVCVCVHVRETHLNRTPRGLLCKLSAKVNQWRNINEMKSKKKKKNKTVNAKIEKSLICFNSPLMPISYVCLYAGVQWSLYLLVVCGLKPTLKTQVSVCGTCGQQWVFWCIPSIQTLQHQHQTASLEDVSGRKSSIPLQNNSIF